VHIKSNNQDKLRIIRLFSFKKYGLRSIFWLAIVGFCACSYASNDLDAFSEDDIEDGHQHKRLCKPESKVQDAGVVCAPFSVTQTPQKASRPILPKYSPETKVSLWDQGVDPEVLFTTTQAMLYTPEKENGLLTVRDQKTRQKIISGQIIPSPCLRNARIKGKGLRVITRSALPRTLHLGNRPPVPVVHLHPSVNIPEEPKEVEEARIERRRNQRALLAQARRQQLGATGDDAWSHEKSTLDLFVQYLSLRKENTTKIRKVEIEETLDEILENAGYQSFEHENYVVWYCLKTMFLEVEDTQTGLTNLELMENGRSPLGFDAKSMHLHHATLYDGATHATTSYLILLSNRAHSEVFADALHFSGAFYWMPKKPVDRLLFNPVRPNIFINLASILASSDSLSESVEETTTFGLSDDIWTDEGWGKNLQPLLFEIQSNNIH
jgi:hypothetical protein